MADCGPFLQVLKAGKVLYLATGESPIGTCSQAVCDSSGRRMEGA